MILATGVAEREELTETGLGSTARCCGRRRHRQANSVRVCSPTSRRVASLRPRSAGLTALTPAPRTLVQIGSCRRCSLIHPLHVVVDVPSRMTLFRATADNRPRCGRRNYPGAPVRGRRAVSHSRCRFGVAPVPWTPILLARRRSPRCRSRDRRTRRHSDSKWSSWFGPDVHRESWLGSSSRRPRRYETGSRRLIATLASAPTACAPKNMRRFVGCAGRTGSCAKNAKFWQKPRPGSRGRPDPGGLPVHEHEPGSFSRRHDGPRARCLHERVLRVASTSTLSSGAG